MSKVAEGGCLCKAIRYRLSGDAIATSLCHCRSCRRACSAPSVAWVISRSVDFKLTAGTPARFRSSAKIIRTFCANCGSPLTYQSTSRPDVIDVTTASLDHPEDFPPAREIWIEHRLPWETLDDSLPHFSGSSVGASPVRTPGEN